VLWQILCLCIKSNQKIEVFPEKFEGHVENLQHVYSCSFQLNLPFKQLVFKMINLTRYFQPQVKPPQNGNFKKASWY
jgi:hypothetical protein